MTALQKTEQRLFDLGETLERYSPRPVDIAAERPPADNENAEEVAKSVIRLLDAHFTRQQVFAAAQWIRYLATQA